MASATAPVVLGIDLGTSSCKAVVFDLNGGVLASGRASYGLYRGANGAVEQAPEELWQGCVTASRAAMQSLPSNARVVGIGVCGAMPTHVFLASDGSVDPRAMIWMDARAHAEAQWLNEAVGAHELERAIGARLPVTATMPPARMVWFAKHRPELLSGGHQMLQAKDFINYRLTRVVATDHMSNLGLVNIRTRRPHLDYLSRLGVPSDLLPPAFEPFEIIGDVCPAAAREIGLAAGIPVAAGWLDSFCNMLGTGLGTPGEAFDVAGTSEILGMTAAAVSDPHPGILVLPLYEELSVVYGLTNAGADALRWCAEAFGLGDGPGGLRALDAEAAKADPGARGLVFLPYVSGERSPVWDDDATGVFFGCLRSHTRPEFARAVVEGLAHSVRQILSLCAAAIGAPPSVVRASGGGTRSRFVNQVKADVLGIPVVAMNSPETAALGAAMLAGIGCGLLTGYDDAVRTMTRESAVFEPHPELGSVYDDAHTVYEALYPALKDVKAAGSRKALLR